MADSGYKSISRTHNPKKNMYGWQVRVAFQGKVHTKFFNENKYGGTEQALQEAIEYRNELEQKLGKPRSEDYVPGDNPRSLVNKPVVRRSRRTTGTYIGYSNVPRYTEVYEVAWTSAPNVRHSRTFSINKFGKKEAYRLACEARDQLLEELRKRRQGKKDS